MLILQIVAAVLIWLIAGYASLRILIHLYWFNWIMPKDKYCGIIDMPMRYIIILGGIGSFTIIVIAAITLIAHAVLHAVLAFAEFIWLGLILPVPKTIHNHIKNL